MTHKASQVIMLGIDGLPAWQLDAMLKEVELPNISRLMASGRRCNVVPTLPPLTAPGWSAIASGLSPSLLGVENIFIPTIGGRPDEVKNGFDARNSRGEFLWQMLGRHDLAALVLKYPGSWPPREGNFTQIDGAGGYADISCCFESLRSTAYVTGKSERDRNEYIFPDGYSEHWRIHCGRGEGIIEVKIRDPSAWSCFQFEDGFEFSIPPTSGSLPLFALACIIDGEDFLVLSAGKGTAPLAKLRVGEWSDWLTGNERRGEYKYRYKLISLSIENRFLHLYRSEGHLLSGFTKPQDLASRLIQNIGPVSEWTGTFDFFNGLIDLTTQLEIYQHHTSWLIKALRWLNKQQRWDGIFIHWHVLEYANHILGVSLSDGHPLRVSENIDRDKRFMKSVYKLADDLVATAIEISDKDAMIVLASDHGHDLVHTLFFINNWLISKRWLVCDGGKIDWSRTHAYALFPGFIYINDKSRWSCGIVDSNDVQKIAGEIASELSSLTDCRTGERVVTHVLQSHDLDQWGHSAPKAADVVISLKRGYEVATRINLKDPTEYFRLTVPYQDETSGHGSFFPESESAGTLAIFTGPNVDSGTAHPSAISVLDLAPTILSALGLPCPGLLSGSSIGLKGE